MESKQDLKHHDVMRSVTFSAVSERVSGIFVCWFKGIKVYIRMCSTKGQFSFLMKSPRPV